MMRSIVNAMMVTMLLSAASTAVAQQMIIYPAKGQTPEQQQKDQGECQVWATQNTGIDPAALAQTPASTPSGSTFGGGERVAGAARGALGGLAIGAIAGDADEGAGVGAVLGTMSGGRHARMKKANAQQQGQTQHEQQLNTWKQAVGACLEARGYTVR